MIVFLSINTSVIIINRIFASECECHKGATKNKPHGEKRERSGKTSDGDKAPIR